MSRIWAILFMAIFIACGVQNTSNNPTTTESKPPNVLFLAIDDLRPELGCYGVDYMKTPNIDALAAKGILFQNAYVSVPVCGASRASILTGLRPSINRFWDHNTRADKDVPDQTTLPEHFKNNGYQAYSLGKIFHNTDDSPESWTSEPWQPEAFHLSKDYVRPENLKAQMEKIGPLYEMVDVPDTAYADGKTAEKAMQLLDQMKGDDQPFFLAVGLYRPHLPFNPPKKYWDMYPESSVELPNNRYYPKNATNNGKHDYGELRKYKGAPKKPDAVSDDLARTLNRGYRASVSYSDALVGKILQRLADNGQADNTIVMLWGDHGFLLGEHDLWCKHVTFDVASRAPLIIYAPDTTQKGKAGGLVEFVDIYPTLCDLAGLDHPKNLAGQSLQPFFDNLNHQGKSHVFTRFKKMETIKTNDFAYTEYVTKAGKITEKMLYDHQHDKAENVNVVAEQKYQSIVDSLSTLLANNRERVADWRIKD
ncbi:MAG: sulfatase [Bacteroidota bacterium]